MKIVDCCLTHHFLYTMCVYIMIIIAIMSMSEVKWPIKIEK